MTNSSYSPENASEIPVVGDILSPLTITDLTIEGGAIARYHGQVVFLDSGVPQATVAARVEKLTKKIITATVTQILKPSPHDAIPWCPMFGQCGGCTWQHITAAAQHAWKTKRVEDTLARLGGVNLAATSLVTGADKNFRTRMTYAFGNHEGRAIIGLRQKNTQEVVSLTECGLQPVAGPILLAVQAFLDAHPEMPVWAQKDGYWRFMTVHSPQMLHPETNKPQVVVEFIVGKAPQKFHGALADFAEELLAQGRISGALIGEKSSSNTVAFAEKTLFKTGQTELFESYSSSNEDEVTKGNEEAKQTADLAVPFTFSPQAFMQTNTAMFSRLLAKAYELVPPPALENIWDLYCGSGVIGQYLVRKNQSTRSSRLFGVDSERKAIKYAMHNARALHGERAEYRAGRIEEVLAQAPFSPSLVILDPPRSGVSEKVIDCIQKSGASHLLYISCDVATQARDIKRLGEGWECRAAAPFDMFPGTPHIENIVLLSRTTQGE